LIARYSVPYIRLFLKGEKRRRVTLALGKKEGEEGNGGARGGSPDSSHRITHDNGLFGSVIRKGGKGEERRRRDPKLSSIFFLLSFQKGKKGKNSKRKKRGNESLRLDMVFTPPKGRKGGEEAMQRGEGGEQRK